MPRFAKVVVNSEHVGDDGASGAANAYEAERAARIEANKARMAQLGILDTTRAIADAANAERLAARNARAGSSRHGADIKTHGGGGGYRQRRAAPAVCRRSTRLSGVAPRDYGECDKILTAADALRRGGGAGKMLARELLPPPRNPEVYTAAHVDALGTCAASWTLFVDGYDSKGNRVYDPVRGRCCHQCRQKTVCKHTSCGGCGQLRGQFCGDCLFMRYGENVDEACAMGDAWRCPPCRDLCNCSFCRQRKRVCDPTFFARASRHYGKGWPPTGTLYRRAIKEGFASVAHYLVLSNVEGGAAAAAEEAGRREGGNNATAVAAEEMDEEGDAPSTPSTPPTKAAVALHTTGRSIRAGRCATEQRVACAPGEAAAAEKKKKMHRTSESEGAGVQGAKEKALSSLGVREKTIAKLSAKQGLGVATAAAAAGAAAAAAADRGSPTPPVGRKATGSSSIWEALAAAAAPFRRKRHAGRDR